MKTKTARRIISDPRFDPALFIGDMIVGWVKQNAEEILKKNPELFQHMIGDLETWAALAGTIPIEVKFVKPLSERCWTESYVCHILCNRILKSSNRDPEIMQSVVNILPAAACRDSTTYEEGLKLVGHMISLETAINHLEKMGTSSKLAKILINAIGTDILRDSSFIRKLAEKYSLKCPGSNCDRTFTTKPAYTLHISAPYRSRYRRRMKNPCFMMESVFDVLRKKLDLFNGKLQGWW